MKLAVLIKAMSLKKSKMAGEIFVVLMYRMQVIDVLVGIVKFI